MMKTTITAQQILDAIEAGFAAGGVDEWDAQEFEAARELTGQAGCVWDFAGWREAARCIRHHGKLGGVSDISSPRISEIRTFSGDVGFLPVRLIRIG